MTDHYAIVNPEDLQPPSQINETDARQPCPDCGAMYLIGPGMSRHRQTAHGAAKANGEPAKVTLDKNPKTKKTDSKQVRKICPECHKAIRNDNLPRHLKNVHGFTESTPTPVAQRTLTQEHQIDLTEDDLFTAAVGILFPAGVIPVAKVEALFKWRDATRRMLQDVHGGEGWG